MIDPCPTALPANALALPFSSLHLDNGLHLRGVDLSAAFRRSLHE